MKQRRRDKLLVYYDKLPLIIKAAIGLPCYAFVFWLTLLEFDIVAFPLMLLMLFASAVLLAGISNRNKTSIVRGIWLCAFSFSIFFGTNRIMDIQTEIGKKKAEAIAIKIDQYKEKNGSYPIDLEQLGHFDQTFYMGLRRRGFRYWLKEKNTGYCLRFYLVAMLEATKCSDRKEWNIDD